VSAVAIAAAFALGGCDWMQKKAPPNAKRMEAIAKARSRMALDACSSGAAYQRLMKIAFDEAIQIRNADPVNLATLASHSVVRMESPVVKSRDDSLDVTVCSGRFIIELPPGAELGFAGQRRLVADVEYAAQRAADGSGLVYRLRGAEPIIYKLAAFDLRAQPSRPGSADDPTRFVWVVDGRIPHEEGVVLGAPDAIPVRPAALAPPLPEARDDSKALTSVETAGTTARVARQAQAPKPAVAEAEPKRETRNTRSAKAAPKAKPKAAALRQARSEPEKKVKAERVTRADSKRTAKPAVAKDAKRDTKQKAAPVRQAKADRKKAPKAATVREARAEPKKKSKSVTVREAKAATKKAKATTVRQTKAQPGKKKAAPVRLAKAETGKPDRKAKAASKAKEARAAKSEPKRKPAPVRQAKSAKSKPAERQAKAAPGARVAPLRIAKAEPKRTAKPAAKPKSSRMKDVEAALASASETPAKPKAAAQRQPAAPKPKATTAARRIAEASPAARSPARSGCESARSRSARMVCGDQRLAALHRSTLSLDSSAMSSADGRTRAELARTRSQFLAWRERCQSQACIADAYQGRMEEIRDIMRR
jgi:hypothetical protein